MAFSIDRLEFASALRGRRPFLAVLELIRADIVEGRLQPGDRLPAQRELARQLGLAVGTVTKAYSEAARQRLVSTEVGRGTFVLGSRTDPMQVERRFDLTFNHVAYDATHHDELSARLGRVVRRISSPEALHFDPTANIGPCHEYAAGWLATMGHDADASRVVICNGVQHGLSLVLQALADSGGAVLTEELGYPGIGLLGRILGFKLHGVDIDENGIDIDSVKRLAQQTGARILVCAPTLHNPTNSILPFERRQQLSEVARELDLTIVEYDVNGIPVGNPLPSLTVLAPERSFFITSTWKVTGLGAALGYIISPPKAVAHLAAVLQATTWTASPLLREIVTAWISDGTVAHITEWHKEEIARRLTLAQEHLGSFDITTHPASYILWLALPEQWRREIFVQALESKGVVVSPADVFVVGRSIAPHAVRVNLGGVEKLSELNEALFITAQVLVQGPQLRIVTV